MATRKSQAERPSRQPPGEANHDPGRSQPTGRPGEGDHPHAFAPSCPFRERGAAFLDRDGVINDQTAFVNAPDDFRLLPGAAAAIRRLNEAGIPIVVVTNQGGIALGYLTEDDLAAIHERMATLLAAEGAHIDKVYYCPYYPGGTIHSPQAEGSTTHPRAEFGPRRSLAEAAPRISDRKPGIGMLERARDELDIDLAQSFLVGDATTDILAGFRAGCTTILVQTGYAGADGKVVAEPDYTVADLAEAADLILGRVIATSTTPAQPSPTPSSRESPTRP